MKKNITLFLMFMIGLVYAQNTPGKYTVKNAKINTSYSDFGTAFFGKDKVVFASPKQGITFTRDVGNNSKQPFLDLFVGEVTDEGGIIKKQKMPGDINTKYHEGMVSFTKDMKTVYFSANWYIKKKKSKKQKTKSTRNIQIFKATIDETGEWTDLVLLSFNSPKFSSGHPALNWDDSKLYFVSDRSESLGKTDIFVVDIYSDGTYSEPRNLGNKINTVEREMFPFIGDDNILYFSSDGFKGYGELDVFASKIFDTTVSEPINLEDPVNSNKDDFAYIIDDSKHKGYFSSNREGGKGDDDIYTFTASPPINIACEQEIIGVVKDIHTQELIPEAEIILFDEEGNKLQSMFSKLNDASFSFVESCNTSYTIKGYLHGYLIGELDLKTVNDLDIGPLEVILNMDTSLIKDIITDTEMITAAEKFKDIDTSVAETEIIKKSDKVQDTETAGFKVTFDKDGAKKVIVTDAVNNKDKVEVIDPKPQIGDTNKMININTIYFDFDKYNIRYDARLELDKIAVVLKVYPEIEIDVNAHTDSRGKNSYNFTLSDNRAKATTEYLVKKGIDPKRISGKGYGELQLATNCPNGVPCTGFQHQLNRRSEFSINQNGLNDVTFTSRSISGDKSDSLPNSGAFVNYNFENYTTVYTVQLGAFHGNVQTKEFNKLTNLFNHRYNDGFNRYFAGIFETSTEARNYMRLMRKKGFEGAFVVGLKGKDRF